jgi:iron complex transport system ATP-binding protein
MNVKAIEVEKLEYRVSDHQILEDVSFSVQRGESLSIVGANGAGKTTLLKCLNRILAASRGSVRILGRPLERFRQSELAKLVAYVPQAGGRLLPFTVYEFVLLGRYPYFSPFSAVSSDDEKAAWEALCLTETESLENRMLETLSGGECQKVLIAAALAQTAEILLLDEPTTFLDPKHQTEIIRILRKTNRESGITMLTVTHDLNSAVIVGERILALKNGRSVFQGLSTEIMSEEILGEIYGQEFDFVDHPTMNRVLAVPRVST